MTIEKNIALFGGSFDPPTVAHEAIINYCLQDQTYDEVWVMPSGERVDKPGIHSDQQRLALLETVKSTVFKNNPQLVISDFELQLPRPSETYDTYQALKTAYSHTRFWFVYGADSIASMPRWHHGDYLRHNLAMIAVPRAGYTLPLADEQLRHIPDMEILTAGVSSSLVRERIVQRQDYRQLVSTAIAQQIERDGLYV